MQRAEDYLDQHDAWKLPDITPTYAPSFSRIAIAKLRQEISDTAGCSMLMRSDDCDMYVAFARRDDVAAISQRGPATPDHVIRTKQAPVPGPE